MVYLWAFTGLFAAAEGMEQIFRMTDMAISPMRIGVNLVPNFGFEDIGSEGIPEGWVWDKRNTDARCSTDMLSSHSGKRSLKFVNGTPFGAHIYGMLWREEPIRLQPGRPYTLSAYVKSDDPGIAWIGGGANWQFRLSIPPTHGEWRRIWMRFVPSDRDADFILRIVTESPTKGFWIDDVKLEEGDEPTPCEPSDERVLIEPLYYERDIEGDGAFEIPFFSLLPKPLIDAEIIAGQRIAGGEPMDIVLLRRNISLERGAWRISIKGEARGLDDTPRRITLKLSDGSGKLQPPPCAEAMVRFFSPIDVERRLRSLSQKLPDLKRLMDELQRAGESIDYPLVTLTVLENFLGYVEEDLRHGEVRRALMQISDMEKMASRLETARWAFPPVPRWTGTRRPKIVGPSFIAPAAPLDRSSPPTSRPIFFVGYGHFGQVRADIEKFPGYGVNIIQIEFGPSDIFPQEGAISDIPIKEMLQVLERAAKAGVAVTLLISPHYFPGWMLDKYPHLRKRRDGFLQFCLHAPEGQELLKRYIATIVPPLKDHPALHSICLTNEPINVEEPCEFAVRDWQEWLKGRHGEISLLNRRWRTSFRSFEDVPLPDPFDLSRIPRPISLDFVRFNQEWFAGWHKMLAEAIKAIAPDLPVHAKAMTWTMLSDGDVRYGVDAELFADFSDINGNDSVNFYSHGRGEFAQGWLQNAMAYELQRSVKDVPVFNTENHIIPDRETRFVPPEHVRAALWQGAVHGQSATTIWVWERTFDPRSDFAGSIMHRPGCAEAVGHTCLDLNRLAHEVTALQKVKPHLLLLHSTSALVWDNGPYTDCRDKLYIALSFMGLKVGFITERQLERGEIPEETPPLFVPNISHLSDKAFEMLRRYKGPVVLVGKGLLSRNEYDELRDRDPGTHNWERISFDYGRSGWQDLWRILLPKLAEWGIEPPVQVCDRGGNPIWGVHWLCASGPDGSLLINLCNYRQDPVELVLRHKGRETRAIDLLSGEEFYGPVPLNPLQVRLLKVQ